GVKQGLPRKTAYRLAAQTALGTAKMILEKGLHPGEIKDMVTSPGGTTIEGCEALEKGGMRGAVIDCINKAAEKSKSL
ncbi:MAG: pyrroline-5-carboxylate reductase family protein, partial [Lachnospiraceae bacterium]